jgi:hypothetical protein
MELVDNRNHYRDLLETPLKTFLKQSLKMKAQTPPIQTLANLLGSIALYQPNLP